MLGLVPIVVLHSALVTYSALAMTGYFNVANRKYYIDERVIDPRVRFGLREP